MSEKPPQSTTPQEQKTTKQEYIQLAKELSQNIEGFQFGGIDDGSYASLKASDEECPGFVTPIDDLIKKFADSGIKVVVENDNVHILPMNSTDTEMDSVFPRHLNIVDGMAPELKKLVLAHKDLFASQKRT